MSAAPVLASKTQSWWILAIIFFLIFITVSLLNLNKYLFAKPSTVSAVEPEIHHIPGNVSLPLLQNVPFLSTTASANLHLGASSALAFDLDHKTILFAKNESQVYYPASTTKVLTALVARDIYNLDDVLTITSQDLAFGNSLGLQIGEQISVLNLLKALLIKSSNESALVLANHYPTGYADFVTQMNEKVTQLGLTTSHFVNPAGFDDPNHKASAFDLAILATELLRDPKLSEIVATNQEIISSIDGAQVHSLTSTNQLLRTQDLPYQVFGVKTGTTDLANEVLITGIDYEGHRFLIVVLSAKNRYNDTKQIANFVIENYIWQDL